MKKVTLLAATVVMAGSLFTACGKSSTPQYEATVDEVFTCGTYDGTALVVNLDATNNTDSYLDNYTVAYSLVATLDGTTLSTSYLGSDNPYAIADGKIKSGESGMVQAAFDISGVEYDEDSELQLELTSYTIKDYKTVGVLDETISMADVEAKVSESEFDVSIDNVTVTDDGEGNNIVVIDYTFTNDSDEATSFGSAVTEELFQDGVALQRGYLPYNHPLREDMDDDNVYTDIKSGASIQVREVFELTSDSNVEIKLTDRQSFDQAVILEKEIQVK